MNIDFHVHGLLSKRKDFNERFFKSEILFAKESNLNGIILCEHFNAINFLDIYDYLEKNYQYEGNRYIMEGISIFPAMEVSIKNKGHVIISGDREDIRAIYHELKLNRVRENFIEFKDLLDMADIYNCLKIGAHPFRRGHKLCNHPQELLKRLDAIDLNAKDIYKKGIIVAKNELIELSREIGVNIITGSDSHTPLQIGGILTKINDECSTVEDLRSAINKGDYSIEVSALLDFKVFTSKMLKRYLIGRRDYNKETDFTI